MRLRLVASFALLGLLLEPGGVAAAQMSPSPSASPAIEASAAPATAACGKYDTAAATFDYPKAPESDASDTFFGTVVADPYRPLESIDAPATKAWVASENALTRCYLDAIPVRTQIAAAYKKLINYPKYSAPAHIGKHYIYSYNTGLQTQSVYYIRDSEFGPARKFWDPNTLSKDGSIQATDTSFTHDGTLMAYSTSVGGEDWQTWHVKSVATGRDTPDLVRWSKFSGAAWDGDRGFYYSGYDAPKGNNARLSALGVQKVWFHRIGTPQSADRLIFAETAHPDRFVGVEVSEDQRYVYLYEESGSTESIAVKERRDPSPRFRPITKFTPDITYSVAGNDGSKLFLYTNDGAPRFRIVSLDLRDPKLAMHDVVPQRADKLDGESLLGNRFYLAYLHDAYSVVRVASTSGKDLGTLPLPGIGSGGLPYGKREDRIAYSGFTSYAIPTTYYRFDTKTMRSTVYIKPKVPFDTAAFVTEQLFATSKDGTKVPVFVTHRKDIVLDGTNPTLLYGYGGFDISETPYYSGDRALWLQMGGVYADAVLRGGGEFGEAWHDAGRLGNKQNVFDDFAAAGDMLVAKKFTSPQRLAIDGGSNGGLLVGAEITQHPTEFAAAIAEQGVLDMLRYQTFTVGKAWIPEYGDAHASAAAFKWLDAYSPLHNVKSGTAYPPTLITTADHDDRVFPAHSFKFAAAMQAAQAGPAPILLRVQTNEGHFSGLTTDESIAIYADFYAFLTKNLNFTPAGL
jgi:prolyl oligopeptidase